MGEMGKPLDDQEKLIVLIRASIEHAELSMAERPGDERTLGYVSALLWSALDELELVDRTPVQPTDLVDVSPTKVRADSLRK